MAEISFTRYITSQAVSLAVGNTTCYTKPNIWLVYDYDGASGAYGNIMKVSPPNIDIEYIYVRLKHSSNVDWMTGGEITLDNVELLTGDLVWLSSQSVSSENGIYTVQTGAWTFYKAVDETVFVDLGARAYDQVDGDLTRNIIVDQNINFNEVGFYTIKDHVLNSQGILS